MESQISATRAAREFSDLLNRVTYRGEAFVVRRGGRPVCRIVPAGPSKCTLADLVEFLRSTPKPDPGYWDDLEEVIRTQPPAPKAPR
jgi:prevent-host-death family protein